ncbi:MAG: hypothetical protein ACSNEK_00495 [Parachlamydiaceae bacterium]
MVERISLNVGRDPLNVVLKELGIHSDPSSPVKRSRNLAFKWSCHKARSEFKEIAELIKNSAAEIKKSPTPGNLFDIVVLSLFGSMDAVVCATIHAIHGVASAIFSPALSIKKSQEVLPQETHPSISFKLEEDPRTGKKSETSSSEEEIGAGEPESSSSEEVESSSSDGAEGVENNPLEQVEESEDVEQETKQEGDLPTPSAQPIALQSTDTDPLTSRT